MASVERILDRLKTLAMTVPGDLLRQPRLTNHPAFEAGRMVGVVEGIDRALAAVEDELHVDEKES